MLQMTAEVSHKFGCVLHDVQPLNLTCVLQPRKVMSSHLKLHLSAGFDLQHKTTDMWVCSVLLIIAINVG